MNALRLVEVGPRDGLQNEQGIVPLEAKVRFVDGLSESGLREIEVGAFVSPERVPQMAHTGEVFAQITRRPGVTYSALVPNVTGLERALAARVDKIAVFTAASETFNRHNIHATIAESIERFRPVVQRARRERLPVRGYISMSFHCPYEGPIAPERVRKVALELLELGVNDVCLSDTVGQATPDDVRRLLDRVKPDVGKNTGSMHFHDTYGRATDNALLAWREYDLAVFDGAAGGLGGCPFAPGAPGNVATEALVEAFQGAGADTGVDVARVRKAALELRQALPAKT